MRKEMRHASWLLENLAPYSRKMVLALLMLLSFHVTAMAQLSAAVDWNSHKQEEVTITQHPYNKDFSYLPSDKVVMLYNTKTKKFLSSGGLYGTQGVLAEEGTPFYLLEADPQTAQGTTYNGYHLYSEINPSVEGNGDVIGYFTREGAAYFDRPKEPRSTWRFDLKEHTGNHYRYYLWVPNAYQSGWEGTGDKVAYYMTAQDNGTVTFKKTPSEYAVWELVTKEDVENEYDKRAKVANGQNPINSSVFLYDPQFIKNNRYGMPFQTNNEIPATDYGKWKWSPASGSATKDFQIGIGTYTDRNRVLHPETQGDGQYHYTQPFAKYSTAQFTGSGTLKQTTTIHAAGWYRLSVQGWSSEMLAKLFACTKLGNVTSSTVWSNAFTTAKANLSTYTSRTYTTTAARYQSTKHFNISDNYDWWPLLYGMVFADDANGTYRQSIDLYIPADGELTFGIEATKAAGASKPITVIDNFKLEFLGRSFSYLDEDADNVQYMLDEANANHNEFKDYFRLYLHRTLNADVWNGIVLPVTLTGHQLCSTFGDDVKLAVCRGTTESSTKVTFETVSVPDDETEVLKAFELYILKLSSASKAAKEHTSPTQYVTAQAATVNVAAPYYIIEDMPLNASQIGSANANKLTTATYGVQNGNGVSFFGTIIKQADGNNKWKAAGSYVFTGDGNLTRLQTSHPIYGFRCWLTDNTPASGLGGAKNFNELISICDGGVTAVERISDIEAPRAYDKVYTLSGQWAGRYDEINRLPRGLYIVKGKKVFVK